MAKTTTETYGAWLREQRHAAGFTQTELGEILRVPQQYVQAWETDRHLPRNIGMFDALDRALELDAGTNYGRAIAASPKVDVVEVDGQLIARLSARSSCYIHSFAPEPTLARAA